MKDNPRPPKRPRPKKTGPGAAWWEAGSSTLSGALPSEKKGVDFEELVRLLPQVVYETDIDCRITFCNQAAFEVFGYTAQDFEKGKSCLDMLAPEERGRAGSNIRDVLKGKGKTGTEYTAVRKDGTRFPVVIYSAPILRDGFPNGLRGIIVDITEQKQAEQAFRSLAQNSLQGLLLIQDGRLIYINPAAVTIIGIDVSDQNSSLLELIKRTVHPDDRARVWRNLQARMRGEEPERHYQFRIISIDGGLKWVEIYASRTDYRGRDAIQITFLDVTERKLAEDEIRRSLKEKETLLKEVHHRVKNNMQIISSLLRLQIGRSSDRMTDLILTESINRIHSMALVHQRLYESDDFAGIDLEAYLRGLTGHLADIYGMRDRIRFEFRLRVAALSLDQAIPFGLIMNELLSNALKHAFPGQAEGRVRVSVRRLEGGRLRFSVADDGRGFPPDFTSQSPNSLGLQLVKALCSQTMGTLRIRRKKPGTEFTVTLQD